MAGMSPLSLKGFLSLAVIAGLGSYAGIRFGARPEPFPGDDALFGVVSMCIGFMVACLCYWVAFIREMRSVCLPAEELLPLEAVLLETPGSIVHFRRGRLLRLWHGI